jgi:hypothetical protein
MGVDIHAFIPMPEASGRMATWPEDADCGALPNDAFSHATDEFPVSHQIWRSWQGDEWSARVDAAIARSVAVVPCQTERDAVLASCTRAFEGILLSFFWTSVTDAASACRCARLFRAHFPDDDELRSMADWLEFWAAKGARFWSN